MSGKGKDLLPSHSLITGANYRKNKGLSNTFLKCPHLDDNRNDSTGFYQNFSFPQNYPSLYKFLPSTIIIKC